MGRMGFCVVSVMVLVGSFMISGTWSSSRGGWASRRRQDGSKQLEFIDGNEKQGDDSLDELRKRLDFVDKYFFHPNRPSDDPDENLRRLAFLGPSRTQPNRETSKNRPCNKLLGEDCGSVDEILTADQWRYLNTIQSPGVAAIGTSKKRSCNVNLGGNCATEDAASVTDQWHYLNSHMSPGRRRKRRSATSGLLAALIRQR